jgi:serine/threonine protein kinase
MPTQSRDAAAPAKEFRRRETISLSLPMSEKPGDKIGRYKLLEKLGEGGFGVVYMAEQEEPVRRRAALKVIKLGMDTKAVIARFEGEMQALALMDHPNIAKVFDGGVTESGRPYFVMELVKGERITKYCDKNNLTTRERLDLFIAICEAIQHAHQKGIIHRDIKPSNILVALHDGKPAPKVIDFGIAKAMDQRLTDKTVFTALEQLIGTPAYMSPEQAEMTGVGIDTRSDIYSLGVLLYELLTGKTPFDPKELVANGMEGMRRTIREEEPRRPSTRLTTMVKDDLTSTAKRRQTDPLKLVDMVRGDLDWIVMKCLEKDRTRRYGTADDLAEDIGRYLNHEPIRARPPGFLYRFQKMAQRHKVVLASSGATAVVLLALFGALVIFRTPLRSQVSQPLPPAVKVLNPAVKAEGAAGVLDLIYSGAPPNAPPGSAAPKLQFEIVAHREGSTSFSPILDGDALTSGVDDYAIVARALSAGYLYIFQVDSAGKTQWIFPANETFALSCGENPLKAGQTVQAPSTEKATYYLDKLAGIEHVYVVFSAARWPQLENRLSQPPTPAPSGAEVALVQEPNRLQTRGIGGARLDGLAADGSNGLPAELSYQGVSYKVPTEGQLLVSSGTFLVIERWFKHVAPN